MVKLIKLTDNNEAETQMAFHCVGCDMWHSFRVEAGISRSVPVWTWNGDMERPTFSPSLLVDRGMDSQCHLFVHDGKIEYLGDCHHDLRGQTIDMVSVE